jgi:hypothetical protein
MSKYSCFIFGNPANKTVTVTAYMWELLIANHVDQSLWLTNQKYWAAIRSNLLHSFLEVHNCVAPFTSHRKLHKLGAENQFPELNRHILTFLQYILLSGAAYWTPLEMLQCALHGNNFLVFLQHCNRLSEARESSNLALGISKKEHLHFMRKWDCHLKLF